jgi:hypothetical protein
MDKKRVIFYYQTFSGLSAIIDEKPLVTHIHLSSIHFGAEEDGQPYIHLNNLHPDNAVFDSVWKELDLITTLGVKVMLMIGGAGGGYSSLFDNYIAGYQLLKQLLHEHSCIVGIDLDIEEPVSLDDVKKLINDIKRDFPHFMISMAPVQSSLQSDTPGMGGFVYKALYTSEEGASIDYFNGQFYDDFSTSAYQQVIDNGYPAEKVVMGSMTGQGSASVISELSKKYPSFGGVFSWEYSITPSPYDWASTMSRLMQGSALFKDFCGYMKRNMLSLIC